MIKLMPKEMREKVCLVLGSRDAEGVTRAGNIAKRGGRPQLRSKQVQGGSYTPSGTGRKGMCGNC